MIVTTATPTCPRCGQRSRHEMPTEACRFFLECPSCHELLRPKEADCCVFCSYADVRCPPTQMDPDAGCC